MNTRTFGLVLAALVALFAVHVVGALCYPLGSDASLFQYHAWAMTQGVMPYRDSFEFNTPGIVLWHAGFTALFGFSDGAFIGLALVVAAACLGGAALWLRGRASKEAIAVGLAGALVSFVAITPWDRGQRELFQGLFLAGAMLCAGRALRAPRTPVHRVDPRPRIVQGPTPLRCVSGDLRPRAATPRPLQSAHSGELDQPPRGALFALLAGVLSGIAVSFKWPLVLLVWFLWVIWLWCALRERRPLFALVALSVLGFVLPNAGWAFWLVGNESFESFLLIQRAVLPVHQDTLSAPLADVLLGRWPLILTGLALVAVVGANRPASGPSPTGTALPLLVLGATVLGAISLYVIQRKGWSYQLHLALPFIAPLLALGYDRFVPEGRLAVRLAAVLVVLCVAEAGLLVRYDLSAEGLERAHRVDTHWNHDEMVKVAALVGAGDPAETIQTNDDELQLLLLARRRAASPYIYGFFASESHPDPVIQRLAVQRVDATHRNPPDWVVWNRSPFRPELDLLEMNPTFRALLLSTCREVFGASNQYQVFRCKGTGSESSLDGPTVQPAELLPEPLP